MEYVQMTLNDWVEMKQKLKRELLGVKQSFVRIGFMLRKIEEQKLYEQDGYKSVAEFAKAELGLEQSTTSRFMSINREYSVDGYSEVLREEYADLGRSQLEEMLKLPEADRKMVQPETSRKDIRDLKRFNKTEPEAGVADDIRKVIENFFKDNEETLNAVFSDGNLGTDKENVKRLSGIINPGGNRSYRKGFFFLIMYEDKIAIKKFGTDPQEMGWDEFIRITVDIFGDVAAGGETWKRYFGKKEETAETLDAESGQQAVDKPGQEEKNDVTQEAGDPAKGKEENKETTVAPAQKKLENTECGKDSAEQGNKQDKKPGQKENDNIPGQMEITKDMPELCPEFMNEPEGAGQRKEGSQGIAPAQKNPENTESEMDLSKEEQPEKISHPYGSRKAYLDKQTEYAAALYIAASIKDMRDMTFSGLTDARHWERWLKAEVDDNGEEIEVVG